MGRHSLVDRSIEDTLRQVELTCRHVMVGMEHGWWRWVARMPVRTMVWRVEDGDW
jgi:hypothetical protein